MNKNQNWAIPEYSKREVNNAGKTMLKDSPPSHDEYTNAKKIINNWRAAHAYPLHVLYINLKNLAQNNTKKDILVVERLKRFDSIIGKLQRSPDMELWRMQDLGGCRCILSSVNDVYAFSESFKNSRIRHELKRTYDYIANPKTSGYRSLHLVYKFHSDKKDTYNKNMLIELQFRTHLQHIWATSLETMGIFTKQNLKASQGKEYVQRFFVLVSSLFALEEGYPIVPNTTDDKDELISEIESINSQYNILDTLRAIQVFSDFAREVEVKKSGYYMLILNYNTRHLKIRYFSPAAIEAANELYAKIESESEKSKIDAVLVRAESFNALRAAYPNYFADISEFKDKITNYLR